MLRKIVIVILFHLCYDSTNYSPSDTVRWTFARDLSRDTCASGMTGWSSPAISSWNFHAMGDQCVRACALTSSFLINIERQLTAGDP